IVVQVFNQERVILLGALLLFVEVIVFYICVYCFFFQQLIIFFTTIACIGYNFFALGLVLLLKTFKMACSSSSVAWRLVDAVVGNKLGFGTHLGSVCGLELTILHLIIL